MSSQLPVSPSIGVTSGQLLVANPKRYVLTFVYHSTYNNNRRLRTIGFYSTYGPHAVHADIGPPKRPYAIGIPAFGSGSNGNTFFLEPGEDIIEVRVRISSAGLDCIQYLTTFKKESPVFGVASSAPLSVFKNDGLALAGFHYWLDSGKILRGLQAIWQDYHGLGYKTLDEIREEISGALDDIKGPSDELITFEALSEIDGSLFDMLSPKGKSFVAALERLLSIANSHTSNSDDELDEVIAAPVNELLAILSDMIDKSETALYALREGRKRLVIINDKIVGLADRAIDLKYAMDGIIERSRRDINKAQYKINAAIDERWEKKTREKIASFDDSRLTPADRSREWFSSLFTGNDLKSARVAKQAEAMWADALIWFKQNRGEQLKERHEKLMKEATDLRGPVKDLRERVKEALSKTDSVSAKLSEGLDSLGRVKDALDPIKNRSKDAGIVFTSESLKRKLAAIVVCIDENQIAVGRFLALPSAPDHALRRLEVEFNDLEGI